MKKVIYKNILRQNIQGNVTVLINCSIVSESMLMADDFIK